MIPGHFSSNGETTTYFLNGLNFWWFPGFLRHGSLAISWRPTRALQMRTWRQPMQRGWTARSVLLQLQPDVARFSKDHPEILDEQFDSNYVVFIVKLVSLPLEGHLWFFFVFASAFKSLLLCYLRPNWDNVNPWDLIRHCAKTIVVAWCICFFYTGWETLECVYTSVTSVCVCLSVCLVLLSLCVQDWQSMVINWQWTPQASGLSIFQSMQLFLFAMFDGFRSCWTSAW